MLPHIHGEHRCLQGSQMCVSNVHRGQKIAAVNAIPIVHLLVGLTNAHADTSHI